MSIMFYAFTCIWFTMHSCSVDGCRVTWIYDYFLLLETNDSSIKRCATGRSNEKKEEGEREKIVPVTRAFLSINRSLFFQPPPLCFTHSGKRLSAPSMSQSAKRTKAESDVVTESREDCVAVIMMDCNEAGYLDGVLKLSVPRPLFDKLFAKQGTSRRAVCTPMFGAEWLTVDAEESEDGLALLFTYFDTGDIEEMSLASEMAQCVKRDDMDVAAYVIHVRIGW